MKRKVRKLSLSRETLRNLQTDEMRHAAGGLTAERYTTCACTEGCTFTCGGTTGGGGGYTDGCPGNTDERYSGCATNCG
jgi:hypothetical protein